MIKLCVRVGDLQRAISATRWQPIILSALYPSRPHSALGLAALALMAAAFWVRLGEKCRSCLDSGAEFCGIYTVSTTLASFRYDWLLGLGSLVHIASVSIDYPSPSNPHRGLFIQRRLAALSRLADVSVVNPVPWFPILRAWPGDRPFIMHDRDHPRVLHRRMFYPPGILKGLDSRWVKRAVLAAMGEIEKVHSIDLIDAHFGYPEGVGCVKAALALRRPVFITMRGLERPILSHRWRGKQLLWASGRCTGIITVSESLKARRR